MAIPVSELQKINPSSIIELYELELDATLHGTSTTYRFHPGINDVGSGHQNIIWNGNQYTKLPIEVEALSTTPTAASCHVPRCGSQTC